MAFLTIHRGRGANRSVAGKALVDDDLLPVLQQHNWHYRGKYPATYLRQPGRPAEEIPLHHFVWYRHHGPDSIPPEKFLDHVNQDVDDSRLENLRLVDASTKQANAPRQSNNSTGYKGVSCTKSGRYAASVSYRGRHHYLGRYARTAEAAHAVNYCYAKLYRDVPTPNQIAPDQLTEQQQRETEANVDRLMDPNRSAFQR
jgi:hypothetical protein